LGVAKWVHEHHQPAGLGTSTLPGATALYLPLQAPRGPVGVLGIRPADRHALDSPDQLHQLETFANQTALAIERAHLADEAQQAQVRIETERLRNSLLSSVSHDLRTPLATITGAATTMLENGTKIDARTRQELLESVREEADRRGRHGGSRRPRAGTPARRGRQGVREVLSRAPRRSWRRPRSRDLSGHRQGARRAHLGSESARGRRGVSLHASARRQAPSLRARGCLIPS